MNRETIKRIIQSEGILPQSKFGQNFLCDEAIIQNIVDLCEIDREDRVLEIGPGLGSITYPMSELTDHLTCIEIDNGLASFLKENISGANIINKDFLKVDGGEIKDADVVVSNIPYYIMTDIMKRLFSECSSARKMVFMVEDEALARIDCCPKTKQYGPLAILGSLYGDYKFEFKVPHTAFVPQPHTTSAVISFSRKETAEILSPEFVKFLNAAFSQRRKLLKKNLASYKDLDKAFNLVGISENARAEELTPEEFSLLYKALPL